MLGGTMSQLITGAKKGKKAPRQPIIAPDTAKSIDYVKVLYALAEGEIVGAVDGLHSIMLDGTPIQGEFGFNFDNVYWDFRPGTIDQTYIEGFPELNNEQSVGIEIRDDKPWVQYISNLQANAVRIRLEWPRLQRQNSLTGDISGTRVDYAIDVAKDYENYKTVLSAAVNDKVSNGYTRSHRIDLPSAEKGWTIRVRRLTPNRDNQTIVDNMSIKSYSEVIDAKLRYPCTAMGALTFDAATFHDTPKFSMLSKGAIVKVPSNYDSATRTYTGFWDGTFKLAWTNNPAWGFYNLALHPMGLGRRIKESMINKWRLYQIAQWCDELVPDGRGGKEPRFTCSIYLQEAQEGYAVLSDIASCFHGLYFWSGTELVCRADMPEDAIYTFNRSNIIKDTLKYSGSAWSERHSTAFVTFSDPDNDFKSEPEPVWNEQSILDYGMNSLDIHAYGCTSRGQAHRHGKWALATEQLETQQVAFQVGLDGYIPMPGDIIRVADELFSGRDNGGRIAAVNDKTITIDFDSDKFKAGDRLIVNLPSGESETRIIQTINGRELTVATRYSEPPKVDAVWVVDSDELASMLFRVMTISQVEQGIFEINAVQHEPQKYDVIDTGTKIEIPPTTIMPPSVQEAPASVTITGNVTIDQGIANNTMTISWPPTPKAVAFDVEWRRDSMTWVRMPRTGSLSVDINGVYKGDYLARVRAINSMDVSSLPTTSMLTRIEGKISPPPVVSFLRTAPALFAISLLWGFPDDATDTAKTEIQVDDTGTGQKASHLGDYAYPQRSHTVPNVAAGKSLWFRARLVDRSGNEGAWSEWIKGEATSDPNMILDTLKGQITSTQLAQELLEKIDSGVDDQVVISLINDAMRTSLMMRAQKTVNGETYVAGMSMGVEIGEEGEPISQFIIAASVFALIDPNTEEKLSPFIYKNGQIIINSALIGEGTITTAKIGDLLASANYVDGESGWGFWTKTGKIEINGFGKGEARTVLKNQGIKVINENGVKVGEFGVNLGEW